MGATGAVCLLDGLGVFGAPTIGFPHTIAGLSWIEEVIETAK